MSIIEPSDARFLIEQIQRGNVILILGAGASHTSRNQMNERVKLSRDLAERIAIESGMGFDNESLQEVLTATTPRLFSPEQIYEIYKSEFSGIRPSQELKELFKYTWKRVYTLNIDDALEKINPTSQQRFRYINGLIDAVHENNDRATLEAIFLHGRIHSPEHGFIMTEAEYNKAISENSHNWYRKLAEDYYSCVPVFIGAANQEPILSLEIERRKGGGSGESGRGFIVTSARFSEIKKAAHYEKGLVHIEADLSAFVEWLKGNIRHPKTPTEITVSEHGYDNNPALSQISAQDIKLAHYLMPISYNRIQIAASRLQDFDRKTMAGAFLMGSPPTWEIVGAQIPVWLSSSNKLKTELDEFIISKDRIFITIGQSGSGKTTAVMQYLFKLSYHFPDLPIYELRGEVVSITAVLNLLTRLHNGHVVLYVGDLFLFGDTFRDDLESLNAGRVSVIATARSSEWHERHARHIGEIATIHDFSRFGSQDYAPLIQALLNYVPAPKFRKASPSERLAQFASSREQLLIALHEATSSRSFRDTITSEYSKLPDDDSRLLLIIVGIGTIARVGVSDAFAHEVYNSFRPARTFPNAQRALSGIVSRVSNNRLFARHELYIRHIIDTVISLEYFKKVCIKMLYYFTKYNPPVVKSVNRLESTLFKFILNHDFIYTYFRNKNNYEAGIEIYKHFEVHFQLDGHFWLQYGLYLDRIGETPRSLEMLRRSIQAFPDNSFAIHALAERQFRQASARNIYDTVTVELLNDAAQSLSTLDKNNNLVDDQYPIVTLAMHHPKILLKYGKTEEATAVARRYYARINEIWNRGHSERLSQVRAQLLKFVTTGEWSGDQGSGNRAPRRRRARR